MTQAQITLRYTWEQSKKLSRKEQKEISEQFKKAISWVVGYLLPAFILVKEHAGTQETPYTLDKKLLQTRISMDICLHKLRPHVHLASIIE